MAVLNSLSEKLVKRGCDDLGVGLRVIMLALYNLVESIWKEMLIVGDIFLEDSLTNISKVFSKVFLAP